MFTQFTCLRIPTAKTFPSSDCKETGRPVGWSRCHNPWTPIFRVLCHKHQMTNCGSITMAVDRITFRIYFHFTSSVLPEYLQKTCCQEAFTRRQFFRNSSLFQEHVFCKITMAANGKCMDFKKAQNPDH